MIKLGKETFIVPQPLGMKSFAFQQKIIPVASDIVRLIAHALRKSPTEDFKNFLEKDVLSVLPEILPYLGEIFARMPDGELEKITHTLLGDCKYIIEGGAEIPLFTPQLAGSPFDSLMRGRTLDTWKLLWHALGVWYPDFLSLGGLLAAKGASANPSEKSNTSNPATPAGA